MTNREKELVFSTDAFDKVYDLISEDAFWNVVEENIFTGKQKIIANCE